MTLGNIHRAHWLMGRTPAWILGLNYKTGGMLGETSSRTLQRSEQSRPPPLHINPVAMDVERYSESRLGDAFVEFQLKTVSVYAKKGGNDFPDRVRLAKLVSYQNGASTWLRCCSALVSSNSILGAMTNRESAVFALCSLPLAILEHRMCLPQNHAAKPVVDIEAELGEMADSAVLGALVGKSAGDRVVVFLGIKPEGESMKAMSFTLASAGAVAHTAIGSLAAALPASSGLQSWRNREVGCSIRKFGAPIESNQAGNNEETQGASLQHRAAEGAARETLWK